jgi:hypothetical protein
MSVFLGAGLDAPIYAVALGRRGAGAVGVRVCLFGGIIR